MRHTQKRGTIVSPVPITLRIVSPHLPGLSMVDMPGLTKVPIDGQPKSIVQVGAGASCGGRSMVDRALTGRAMNATPFFVSFGWSMQLPPGGQASNAPAATCVTTHTFRCAVLQELENMAREYVKHENVIILAVTPANADLATSDALRLAREVDPSGERTIGAGGWRVLGCCRGVRLSCCGVGMPACQAHCQLLPSCCPWRITCCRPFLAQTQPSSHVARPAPRTLAGVLTKIDIMDPGTNCRDVLEGQTYQLRNGWIGVVNRGQADINSRVGGITLQRNARVAHSSQSLTCVAASTNVSSHALLAASD